ncbi:hypothetical protein AYO21_12064 [Fonsecaea monophora]|uniref:Poly(A) polymerase nucleotidyltransferase domain-containing protein n=1 Tax=Fonsecaea monophora TaxID=254056 RepID=A0A177EPC0_9EURO|nr:hypothetical protein AYO21_12064 [Fonsecaea monophora]OAG33835.1 hypothetical protein AYO21_12064 [Fonsecaea monophora]
MFHWRLKNGLQGLRAPVPLDAALEYLACRPERVLGVQRGRNESRLAHTMANPELRNRKHGTAGSMSMALPEPLVDEKTAELIEELKRENNYEGQIETEKRMYLVKLLSKVWILVAGFLYCFNFEGAPVSNTEGLRGSLHAITIERTNTLAVYGSGNLY